MKMNLIILSIIGLSISNSTAQKLSWAPELGFNVSLLNSSEIGYNAQLGYNGGLRIRYKFNSKFALNSGVLYNLKKIQYNQSYEQPNLLFDQLLGTIGGGIESFLNTKSQVSIEGRINENFIEIPLQLVYTYKRLNITGGPYLGYLLFANRNEIKETRFALTEAVDLGALLGGGTTGALINSFLPPAYSETTSSSSSKNDLNNFDFGATLGIGYELDNFCFNVSYAHGLLNYQNSSSNLDFRSFRIISVTTSYYFNLKKKEKAPIITE